jgi:hypothetical protein
LDILKHIQRKTFFIMGWFEIDDGLTRSFGKDVFLKEDGDADEAIREVKKNIKSEFKKDFPDKEIVNIHILSVNPRDRDLDIYNNFAKG